VTIMKNATTAGQELNGKSISFFAVKPKRRPIYEQHKFITVLQIQLKIK